MIYTINGTAQNSAWDYSGDSLTQCYDMHCNPLLGEHKPIKHYNYANDADSDKNIVWNYNLNSLRNMQSNNFTIGIMTDTHYLSADGKAVYPNEPASGINCISQLKNMTKRLYFDCIAHLGDICHGWSNETPAVALAENVEVVRRLTSYAECPVLIARGNHDDGMYHHGADHPKTLASVISKYDLYDVEIGTVKSTTAIVEGTGNDFYYYKDFNECRVIVLDTNDYPYLEVSSYDIHGNHHTISENQVTWFKNVALNTDKPIIVMSHNVLTADISTSMVVPIEDKWEDGDPSMIPYRAWDITDALENFVNDGGTVVACFAGHIHRQGSVKVNGINHIAFGDGGYCSEICFVDFEKRTITTNLIGTIQNNMQESKNWTNRTFTF